MRRVLVLSLASAALALSGCSGGDEGSLDSPSDSSSPAKEGEEGEKFTAEDGDDYDACRDGTCEVEIRDSVTIPLDEKFGVTRFEITVVGDEVSTTVDVPGGQSASSISGQGKANVQGFAINVLFAHDGIAVVSVDYQG